MADALSEALQKLSIARTQTHSAASSVGGPVGPRDRDEVANPVPLTASTSSDCVAECISPVNAVETSQKENISAIAEVPMSPTASATATIQSHESPAMLSVPREDAELPDSPETTGNTVAVPDVELPTNGEVGSGPASVVNSTFARVPAWRRATSYLLENRRHAAAVVVLICMGFFWLDDSSTASRSGDGSETFVEDFSDVEAALSEFDVQSAPPLKEPAEPVDVASGFDLTIPAGDSATANHDSGSSESGSVAAYPDSPGSADAPTVNTYGGSGNVQTGNSWPGVPASAVSAPEGSGRSVKARLSRSIEPIN